MAKNALLSVYDKTGIDEFAKALVGLGFTIYASGGTFKHLTEKGVPALPVSDLVGGEAILGHRVVTLSREVHAGLLATNTKEDIAELARLNIPQIDLVRVDMYPLEAEIAKPGSTRESVIEQTDIGGPTYYVQPSKAGASLFAIYTIRTASSTLYRTAEWTKRSAMNFAPEPSSRSPGAAWLRPNTIEAATPPDFPVKWFRICVTAKIRTSRRLLSFWTRTQRIIRLLPTSFNLWAERVRVSST